MTRSAVYSWDQRRDLAVPGGYEETLTFCVEHFVTTAQNAIHHHDKFFVALSGGSTPKAIYEALASARYQSKIDWKKVYLFWSDERSVSPDDKDSNYNMAMRSGLQKLPIPEMQIFRMVAETDINENARKYEQKIQATLGKHLFDLIMLGMGDDGHTASLFPQTEALREENKWVVANFIPQKKTWRMTMTLPCINRASQIVLYVLGEKKAKMLSQVLTQKQALLPSAKVGSSKHKALWIADKDAAKDLLKLIK